MDIEVETAGVEVTLIDFTLSRLRTADGAGAFCDLSADPALFKGKRGDCQVSICTLWGQGSRISFINPHTYPGLRNPKVRWLLGF